MRLPQLGQLDKKEKYSFTLVLFHLCEQETQNIFKSNDQPTNKKPASIGLKESIYGKSRSGAKVTCINHLIILVNFASTQFSYTTN